MHTKILLFGLISILGFASVANAARVRPCRDLIKGNGKIVTGGTNETAKFKIRAGSVDGQMTGALNYRDKARNLRLVSRELVEYVIVDDASRRLKYLLRDSEGNASEVIVLICDFGPGPDDVMEIYFPDQTSAGGNLVRGNVRLKRTNCGAPE